MGSFNTACFVSHQIIALGDKAVILPIVQQATYNPVDLLVKTHEGVKEISKYGYCHSSCYPTAFWGYAGPMIKGKYDDYGQFALDDSDANIISIVSFLNYLSEKVCDVKQGENECHDVPLSFKDLYNPKETYDFDQLVEIWEAIWDVGQEARLFVTDYNGEPHAMAFAVMHQCAADYLIKMVSRGKNYQGWSMEPKKYFNKYINSRLSRHFELFKDKREKSDILSFIAIGLTTLDGFGIGEQEGTYLSQYYGDSENIIDVINAIVNYFNENPDATSITQKESNKIYKEFKTQIEHRYLATGLSWMNLKLTPMVYGSQDYHNELGNDYLKMLIEINKHVNDLVKEKYGEDDEE